MRCAAACYLYLRSLILPSKEPTQNAIATRLPPEVLLQVFLDCVEEDAEEEADGFSAAWIQSLAHVCHYWRELALDYPLLWSNIVFTRSSKILPLKMLELSRNVPISIRVNLGCAPHSKLYESVQEVLHHAPRAKEISLESVDSERFNNLLASLPASFPFLERLSLKGILLDSRMMAFQVPSQLFTNDPLSLRSLTLHHCATTFDEQLFPVHCHKLVNLDLCHVGPLRCDTILTILENATNLETISIDSVTGFMPTGGLPEPQPNQIVDLPNLTRLALCDQAFAVFSLLRYLSFPIQAVINLRFSIGTFLPFPIFSLLTSHLARSPPMQSILLHAQDFRARRGLRVMAWNKNIPPEYFYIEDLPAPKLDVHFSCTDGSDDAALRIALNDLLRSVTVSSVHSLTIARITQVIPTDLWSGLLSSFAFVRDLCLHGSTAIRNISTVLGSSMSLLPKLETLTIYEAAFRSSAGARDFDFSALMGCLKAREKNGKKVPRLVVCYSDARREDMEVLAGCASEFVWDGSQQGRQSVPVS